MIISLIFQFPPTIDESISQANTESSHQSAIQLVFMK